MGEWLGSPCRNDCTLYEWCEVLWWVCLSVCVSVCLSVRSHNSKTTWPNFANFYARCMRVAVARFSSDGVAIRYALPILRMTSCFHAMGPGGRIKQAFAVKQGNCRIRLCPWCCPSRRVALSIHHIHVAYAWRYHDVIHKTGSTCFYV